ncbi:MAG TPA: gamma-glutamyltransferase [Bryobacteraceae bacterium]|nr:gamma-glutamyltransferase [Bryobacteraceae bacterium]
MAFLRRAAAVLVLAAAVQAASRAPVRTRHAMVVTRETHATSVGVAVLKAGGNAVDAAVAVGLALAVTHPAAGNVGGGGFMLLRFADGRTTFLDFRERAPERASRNMYLDAAGNPTRDSTVGYRAAGVPGTVAGLEFAHRKYGRKPWAELITPAVELAREGFPVSWSLAASLRGASKLLEPFADSKRIFLNGGKFYESGDTLVQPELARTLDRIRRDGAKGFYEGETARLLAADMEKHGGLISLADLKNYRVMERRPLTGKYRGYDIISAPPPSSGGVGLLQMLGVLEGSGYEKSGAGSAAAWHYMAEAMRRYFADRATHLGDPDFVKVPVSRLLDPHYIAGLRQSILRDRATPSKEIHAGEMPAGESNETTHYSIVDPEGNAVAVTYTLNGGYGNGVTATGLGFLLNNEMDDFAAKPGFPNYYGLVQGEPNAIQPRKRPLSSMTPTVVLRDGKLYLVVGSPGGPTIINTVLQVLVNVLDFGMNAQEATDFPRVHHQWLPDELRVERGISPGTLALLEARGHRLHSVNALGEVAAILWDGQWLQGAPDCRTDCTAEGF